MGNFPKINQKELDTNQGSIVPLTNTILWHIICLLQGGALAIANEPAGGESNGDIYLVGDTPAGDFAAADPDDVALRIANGWWFLPPGEGWKFWVESVSQYYRYDSAAWVLDDPYKTTQTLTPADNITVDWSLGSTAYCLLDRATTTFAFTGAYDGQVVKLCCEQDGSGDREVAFGAEVIGSMDTPIPPVISAAANARDWLVFIYNGQEDVYEHVALTLGFS
jgi:hypothetical protein